MKKNVGTVDRIARAGAGALLSGLGFTGVIPGTLGIVLGVVGVVLLGTAAVGFCPLYAVFGLNTCPLEQRRA